jgi:hypothetical protein
VQTENDIMRLNYIKSYQNEKIHKHFSGKGSSIYIITILLCDSKLFGYIMIINTKVSVFLDIYYFYIF